MADKVLTEYVGYDLSTGEIVMYGTCYQGELAPLDQISGVLLMEINGIDNETQYINTLTEEPIARPVMGTSINKTSIVANGVDQVTISSIPVGTEVLVVGPLLGERTSMNVNDGSFEFTTEEAGTYTITLRNFPSQKEEYTIGAS
jgi:hypothetical protein